MLAELVFAVVLANIKLDFSVGDHAARLVAIRRLVDAFGSEDHDEALDFGDLVFYVLDKVASLEHKPMFILRLLILSQHINSLYGFLASFGHPSRCFSDLIERIHPQLITRFRVEHLFHVVGGELVAELELENAKEDSSSMECQLASQ